MTILVSGIAGATGIPAPDYSKWARETLKDSGIKDAVVVDAKYPFNFTFCKNGSLTLRRYNVMSSDHLNEILDGKTTQPLTQAETTVKVEEGSESCKAKG